MRFGKGRVGKRIGVATSATTCLRGNEAAVQGASVEPVSALADLVAAVAAGRRRDSEACALLVLRERRFLTLVDDG